MYLLIQSVNYSLTHFSIYSINNPSFQKIFINNTCQEVGIKQQINYVCLHEA